MSDDKEELVPGKTENLSSTHHEKGDAARPHDLIDKDEPKGGSDKEHHPRP